MKLGFVVNDILTEQDNYTTIRLARRALAEGHEVSMIGLDAFIYAADESICALAHRPGRKDYADDAELLADLVSVEKERIAVADLDVLMLRSDPANELGTRAWAPPSALLFAQLAALRQVIVLNDPIHLAHASNKTYFQGFPAEVRPVTCISYDPKAIRDFADAQQGGCVIKPLQGSGGRNVFVVMPGEDANINQIIEAVTRDGYAIAQEYLPEAREGDLRMITLNGRPLQVDGRYACFRRRANGGDARSNISAGGSVELAEPDERALWLAEMVAPKLIRDGMYLAGLDIVGDKMIEINVDTPGGINVAEDLTGVDFSGAIIADLVRKVQMRDQYKGTLTNVELACL